MKECPKCHHKADEKEFKPVVLEPFEATVTVQVSFEIKVDVDAPDRKSAARQLEREADDQIRKQLDDAGIEWMDSSVDKLPLHDVGRRKWTAEEVAKFKQVKPTLSFKDIADLFPDCEEEDVRDLKLELRKGLEETATKGG